MHTIRVVTEYKHASDEWVDWYCKRLMSQPDLKQVAMDLTVHGQAVFESEDPDGEVMATTTYEIISARPLTPDDARGEK